MKPFTALALGVVLQMAPPAFAGNDNPVPALGVIAARPGQTVRGMVTAVDESSDGISLRLPNDDSEDFKVETFKVQDGLVFNSVRFGDEVEVTVESIDGARTIVTLRKE